MKILELSKLPLNEVYQYVNREQLIIMIANQQLSNAISYCNHFQLNGLELSEVASRYDNSKTMKMELIKGLFVHCPNSRSTIFVDTALKICNTILGDDNHGKNMTARMYVSIFRTISKHFPDNMVDKSILKNTAHFILTYDANKRIIDDVLLSEKISTEDLEYVLKNNEKLNDWFVAMDVHNTLKNYPKQYHTTITRHHNRLKLIGKI